MCQLHDLIFRPHAQITCHFSMSHYHTGHACPFFEIYVCGNWYIILHPVLFAHWDYSRNTFGVLPLEKADRCRAAPSSQQSRFHIVSRTRRHTHTQDQENGRLWLHWPRQTPLIVNLQKQEINRPLTNVPQQTSSLSFPISFCICMGKNTSRYLPGGMVVTASYVWV